MTTEGDGSVALEAIVLAGGSGKRFGGGKLIAPWRGGRLIDGALGAAFAAPARSVIVVTGADERVAGAATALARRLGQLDRLRIVHAVDHAEGMAATLRTGIASLPPDAEGAFVFLGDMPLTPPDVLARLAATVRMGAAAAAPVFEGKRGHPVLFGAGLFAALRALKGDEGARSVLARLPGLALVEASDEGVLFDVDFADDIARAGRL